MYVAFAEPFRDAVERWLADPTGSTTSSPTAPRGARARAATRPRRLRPGRLPARGGWLSRGRHRRHADDEHPDHGRAPTRQRDDRRRHRRAAPVAAPSCRTGAPSSATRSPRDPAARHAAAADPGRASDVRARRGPPGAGRDPGAAVPDAAVRHRDLPAGLVGRLRQGRRTASPSATCSSSACGPACSCRELAFPFHPHVTVAHDLPHEALDRARRRWPTTRPRSRSPRSAATCTTATAVGRRVSARVAADARRQGRG